MASFRPTLISSALCFLFSVSGLGDEATPAGHAVSIQGGVRRNAKPLTVGEPLQNGDVIATSQDSRVKLLLTDQSVLDLGPATTLKLGSDDKVTSEGGTDLELQHGRVRALVKERLKRKGRFQFRTRSSVLSVRGTEFVVTRSIAGETVSESFSLAKGLVSLRLDGARNEVSLEPSEQLSFDFRRQGEILVRDTTRRDPVKLDGRALGAVMSEARVEDTSFAQYVTVAGQGAAAEAHGGIETLRAIDTTFIPPPPTRFRPRDLLPTEPSRPGQRLDSGSPQIRVRFKK